MPGTVPAGNETLLHALPEDQPDSLSKGHKSKQADIDATPAQKAGGSQEPASEDAAPKKSSRKSK